MLLLHNNSVILIFLNMPGNCVLTCVFNLMYPICKTVIKQAIKERIENSDTLTFLIRILYAPFVFITYQGLAVFTSRNINLNL